MFEKPSGKEVEHIDPEILEKVEGLNLDLNQKGELLLVEGGVKPATLVDFDVRIWQEGEEPFVLKTEEDVKKFFETINQMNVLSQAIQREIRTEKHRQKIQGKRTWVNTYHDHTGALIGSTGENLNRLVEAIASGNHESIGGALGYPPTAIEAFAGKRTRLDLKKIPREILLGDGMTFVTPTLSQDNWENEIKTGEQYAQFLKKESPELYKLIMEKRKDTLRMWGLL